MSTGRDSKAGSPDVSHERDCTPSRCGAYPDPTLFTSLGYAEGARCCLAPDHEGKHKGSYGEDKYHEWDRGSEQKYAESFARLRVAEARAQHEAAQKAQLNASNDLNEAVTALSKCVGERWPREDELTYALGATCAGCGAPMAYWPDRARGGGAWDCADVLLGRVGSPEDKALVVERSMFTPEPPPAPEGKVLHDRLPFAFWKVKSDPARKTR